MTRFATDRFGVCARRHDTGVNSPTKCVTQHCHNAPTLDYSCACRDRQGFCHECATKMRMSGCSERCPYCDTNLEQEFTRQGIPVHPALGFTTVEFCNNQVCRQYLHPVQNYQWEQGLEINLVDTEMYPCSMCKQSRTISALRFKKCHAQVLMRAETPTGEVTWTTEDKFCSLTKPALIEVPVDLNIRVMKVSTVKEPKLPPPPQKRQGIEHQESAASLTEEHVFVDDEWLDHFLQLCHDAGTPTRNQILDSLLVGDELSRSQISQLRTKALQRKQKHWQPHQQVFKVDFSPSPTLSPTQLFLPATTEDSIMIIYWYTLETPPVYERVSKILNHPTIRVDNPERVQAVVPFIKGLMNAVQQVCTVEPRLWYGPASAYRGVAYRYSADQWAKYEEGNHLCWYTVKSLTTNPEAIAPFLGNAPRVTIFVIVNCEGVMIRPFSEFEREDEVLLLPGTRFRVIQATRTQSLADADVWRRADIITMQMLA